MSETPERVLNSTVPCKVIAMHNNLHRRGRRGVAELRPGTSLYYLWHEPTGLFWKECYVSQTYAIRKAARTTGPRSISEVAEYWVTDTKLCEHSHRSEDEDEHR